MNTTRDRGKVNAGMARIIETIARHAILGTGQPNGLDAYLECFGLRAVDIAHLIDVKVRTSEPAPALPTTLSGHKWDQEHAKHEVDARPDHAWYRLTPWERGFLMENRTRIAAGEKVTNEQLSEMEKTWRARSHRYQHMAG